MFSIPAITWALTAVLLLSGSHRIMQAARSRQLTDQINRSLHALMHVLMAAMLWNLAPSTMLVQIAILAGATLWFIIQAVARPEFKTLCADGQGRLKCVYHSLTMAGAALMLAMMGHISTTSYRVAPSSDEMAGMPGMAMSPDYHAMATTVTTTATSDHSPGLAILLTAVFTTAAIIFIILLLRTRAMENTHHNTAAHKLSTRTEHGLEALGAAVMALMFATMTT